MDKVPRDCTGESIKEQSGKIFGSSEILLEDCFYNGGVFVGDSDTSANNEPDEDNTKKDLSDDDSDNESNTQSPRCVDGKASAMSNGAPFIVSIVLFYCRINI